MTRLSLIGLAALFATVLAIHDCPPPVSYTRTEASGVTSNLACFTEYQAAPAPEHAVPTSTSLVTLRPDVITVHSYVIPVVTYTEPAKTTTVKSDVYVSVTQTSGTITAGTVTTTKTVTSPTVSKTSVVETTTTHVIATTITTTTTYTKPTPSGWKPIKDTVGHKNYGEKAVDETTEQVGSKLELRDIPEDEDILSLPDANVTETDDAALAGAFIHETPKSIKCGYRLPLSRVVMLKHIGNLYLQQTWIEKIIHVGPPSVTTVCGPTSTTTFINTITTTTTIPHKISTTTTKTTTIPTTTTLLTTHTHTTSTTTTLTAQATTTLIAACQPRNFLGPRIDNGGYASHWRDVPGTKSHPVKIMGLTEQSCCELCFYNDWSCMWSDYWVQGKQCTLRVNEDTCPKNEGAATLEMTKGQTERLGIWSNGPCGKMIPFGGK